MKKYKIKKTKKLIKQLKLRWKLFKKIETQFNIDLAIQEVRMEEETGIKGIEFFQCEGNYIGIGNVERTMPLIHGEELEK